MSTPHISEQLRLAVAALKAGQVDLALEGFSQILAIAPQHRETRKRLAHATRHASTPPQLSVAFLINLFKKGDLQGLDSQLETLLQAHPLSPVLWELRGAVERARNDKAAALRAFRFAAMLGPSAPTCHNNLGLALQDDEQLEAAMKSFQRAIDLKPDYFEAFRNLGLVQKSAGETDSAILSFRRAIEIRPDYAEAHYSLANVMSSLNRFEEALESFDQALSLKPDYTLAHFNKAAAHRSNGQLAEARSSQTASLLSAAPSLRTNKSLLELCKLLIDLEIVPALHCSQDRLNAAHDDILGVSAKIQDWTGNNPELLKSDVNIVRQACSILSGFYFGYQIKDDRALLEPLCPSLQQVLNLPTTPFEAPRRSGKLRIGIAAQQLRNHNGANYCYHWFANLPKEDYEFFTYSFGPSTDALGEKFRQLGSHRNVRFNLEKIEDAVADIRQDDLDFLMLPEVGMTNASRMLSMCRMARHQATGWGHPITTGSSEMDFFISSDLHEGKGAEAHYSEELVLMPNLAQFVEPPVHGHDPDAFSFDSGTVLFGCLQSLFKYVPEYDVIFPMVANEIPQARFVFLEGSPPYLTQTFRQRLDRAFERHSLDAGRHVIFLPRQSSANYDNLMQKMDVLIDTVGWCGGNTSLKSLGMDKPLVTLPGTYMRGRHTLAMYSMIGNHDLVAKDRDDMVKKLVRLATDVGSREEASWMIRQRKPSLYRDHDFIGKLDVFLKDRLA